MSQFSAAELSSKFLRILFNLVIRLNYCWSGCSTVSNLWSALVQKHSGLRPPILSTTIIVLNSCAYCVLFGGYFRIDFRFRQNNIICEYWMNFSNFTRMSYHKLSMKEFSNLYYTIQQCDCTYLGISSSFKIAASHNFDFNYRWKLKMVCTLQASKRPFPVAAWRRAGD